MFEAQYQTRVLLVISTRLSVCVSEAHHNVAGMLVLVAAIGLAARNAAVCAFSVIHRLLACPGLPAELMNSAEEALLQYQAVPRLCNILGPDIPDAPVLEADDASEHPSLFPLSPHVDPFSFSVCLVKVCSQLECVQCRHTANHVGVCVDTKWYHFAVVVITVVVVAMHVASQNKLAIQLSSLF